MKLTIRSWLVRALATIGLLLLLVTVTPVVSWWAEWLAGRWEDPKGEILIVLGAEDMGSGGPGQGSYMGYSSYLRSYYAVRTWREGAVKEILIVGRNVSGPMRDYLVQHGVPSLVITTEDESNSTKENAEAARRLLSNRPGKRVLLTSVYHMRRAAAVFRRQGVEVVTAPLPDAIKQASRPMARWMVGGLLVEESVKLVGYWAKGWL